MKNLISKTDYTLFRECQHNAWIKKWQPDIYYASPLSEFEMHLIQSGNMVEETARKRFPEGMLVEERGEESLPKTKELLKNAGTFFQASFSDGTLFAATDILRRDEKGSIYIYEVKASNSSKLENDSEEEESNNDGDEVVNFTDTFAVEKYKKEILKDHHLYDLAFQVYLARKTGYTVAGAYLLRLNREYVRAGDIDLNKLFVIEDVLTFVDEVMPKVQEEIQVLIATLGSEKEPSGPCCCVYKGRSNHCTTFAHHNKDVPTYGVHDLTRIGNSKKRLYELIDSRIYDILKIPDGFKFGKKITKQVEVHKRGKADIDHDAIRTELETLQFPLYFVDYESFNPAIPRFSGYKPYQQIPFQFSLHILNSPEAEPTHEEFLYTGDKDPSPLFIEDLRKKMGKVGSVIVWFKPFEATHINKRLAIRMPEHAEFLNEMNARMFDLMTIFSKQLHIHPDFHGSASIKKVLPVLCPELSYKELDIGNGSEAMNTWNRLVTEGSSESERAKTEKAMLEYCALDTYAMYAIWRHLVEIT
ncbi:MAG: DUF2779 domain-containing protein [Patescibacteria group bacterium]